MGRTTRAIGWVFAPVRRWWKNRPVVCDVCFEPVSASSEFCPHCGADFTDEDREYHELGVPHPDFRLPEDARAQAAR